MELLLEDNSRFVGRGFGATGTVEGEVVFNTGMTGYVEALTDPSYRGQILVLTYPLAGNYGVPAPRAPDTLERPYESGAIQVQGLVVQNYVETHSHQDSVRSLGEWMAEEGVPGITGIDTRSLTRLLRGHGTMRGWLCPPGSNPEAAMRSARRVDMNSEVFRLVAPAQTLRYGTARHTVLLVDIGAKDNIVRSLLDRDVSVLRAPWHADLLQLAGEVDGILIGNGPGDPKDLSTLIRQLRVLLDTYRKPIFGICLGHQLLSLAAGGETYKLPYGHRGVNQPVQDLLTRRCFITSQNHGYAVMESSLPKGWEPWFVNLNDGTNEGIRALGRPFFSVQFHPEAQPGPRETSYLFDEFLSLVRTMARS